MERIKLSSLSLIKKRDEISGSFASVRGEYYIPQIGRTGFYKENTNIVKEIPNEYDLRELFCSRIFETIGTDAKRRPMIGRLFFLTLIRRHGIIKNVQKISEKFCSFSR